MIQAVIFDLDGLLVDSEPVWFQVRTDMCSRFQLQWTDEDQKALMGRSTQAWIDYVYEKLSGKLTKEKIVNETLDGMVSHYLSGRVKLMPDAQKALDECAAKFTLGLASGSPNVLIDAALEANKWGKYFSQVLSSDEVPRGKPAPDAYLEVMKRLSVKPQECAVIEDSGSGILAGKAAGATVIAVPNEHLMPSPETLQSADVNIDSLASLSTTLDKLQRR